MGIVYRIRHPELRTDLAIKRLRPEVGDDAIVRARFAIEAQATRRLNHRNIVRFIDAGPDFLVMEHVAGIPLSALSDELQPLARVISICEQVLGALAHAHAHGVVHADVKPDNLLIATADEIDRVTLIDFGVAQLIDDRPAVEDPMVSGTPEYMAPEVIRGELPTAAADLYAVGVILYELLTGHTPFNGGGSAAIMMKHLEQDVVPPSLRCTARTIQPAMERVVMRALAKRPDRRYATASEFAVALHDAVRGHRDVESLIEDQPRPVAFASEAPTHNWSSVEVPDPHRGRRFARGTRPDRHKRTSVARNEIGDAIIRGDTAAIAAGYLELARLLVSQRRLHAAATELEEALALLSPLDVTDRGPPIPAWPICLSLAAVYDGLGDPTRAQRIGRRALDLAARAGSSTGTARAMRLLARLAQHAARCACATP